jgi:hypothetical protein
VWESLLVRVSSEEVSKCERVSESERMKKFLSAHLGTQREWVHTRERERVGERERWRESSRVQELEREFKSSRVQEFKSSRVQEFKSSRERVQELEKES